MSPAPEPYRLDFPRAGRRPFDEPGVAQRLARAVQLDARTRVLVLGASGLDAAVALARAAGGRVVLAAVAEDAAQALRERLQAEGVGAQVELREPSSGETFDLVLALDAVRGPPEAELARLRELLGRDGRVAFVFPVRVGRGAPSGTAAELWTRRLGEPLPTPAGLLQLLAAQGYEPELAEALDADALEALFRDADALEGAPASWREEARASWEGVSYALALGRRREPDERPPASHDLG